MGSRGTDEHKKWLRKKTDNNEPISMPDFAKNFTYLSENDADKAFTSLLSATFINQTTRTVLQENYAVWKRNDGPKFWASQRAILSLTETADELVVEGSFVAKNLVQESRLSMLSPNQEVTVSSTITDTSSSTPPHANVIGTASTPRPLTELTTHFLGRTPKPSSSSRLKNEHQGMVHVNNEKDIKFPEKPSSMDPLHAELFDHSLNLLAEFQSQDEKKKDITLVKDAQYGGDELRIQYHIEKSMRPFQ
ncbi:hypothetical protein BGZ76_003595 [Entomortierella beljakovae]|nr:hypothetical protein BGZ76_003595 [Entomortierella beljakovae]